MKSSRSFTCPNCGETVPAKAAACPFCGSDENTGWSESTYLDGIDTGDDFDYEEIRKEEFSVSVKNHFPAGRVITGTVLLLLFLIAIIKSLL
jgi:hypothetical protein